MINNHIRTIVRTAAGTTLLALNLGLAAVGVASAANAAPVHPPQSVCWETYSDGSIFYYYF